MPPRQKPGQSEQVVVTRMELIRAVERRFGPVVLDLAATAKNARAKRFFGPPLTDSLALNWERIPAEDGDVWWLNPPFENLEDWAKKCHGYRGKAIIVMLSPASVSSTWFATYVFGRAAVEALHPRPTFEGHSEMYPKDVVCFIFYQGGRRVRNHLGVWRWSESPCYPSSGSPQISVGRGRAGLALLSPARAPSTPTRRAQR